MPVLAHGGGDRLRIEAADRRGAACAWKAASRWATLRIVAVSTSPAPKQRGERPALVEAAHLDHTAAFGARLTERPAGPLASQRPHTDVQVRRAAAEPHLLLGHSTAPFGSAVVEEGNTTGLRSLNTRSPARKTQLMCVSRPPPIRAVGVERRRAHRLLGRCDLTAFTR